MPDAVLAVLAAGIGLVAVAMAEARIQAKPHRVTGRDFAKLLQHVDRTGTDRDATRHHGRAGQDSPSFLRLVSQPALAGARWPTTVASVSRSSRSAVNTMSEWTAS